MKDVEKKWWFAGVVALLTVVATRSLLNAAGVAPGAGVSGFLVWCLCFFGLWRVISFALWLVLLRWHVPAAPRD